MNNSIKYDTFQNILKYVKELDIFYTATLFRFLYYFLCTRGIFPQDVPFY